MLRFHSLIQSDEGLLFQATHQQDQPQFPREISGKGLSQQLHGRGTHTNAHCNVPVTIFLTYITAIQSIKGERFL